MSVFNVRFTVTLGVAILAILAVAWHQVRAAEPRTFTVHITDAGFDPPLCRISRSDIVNWENTGTKPHRVIWPDPNGPTPLFDTGEIAPGQTSLAFKGFEFPNQWRFKDTHNPDATGIVVTPVWSNDWDPSCEPSGAPPAPVIPRGCQAPFYCAILPALAAE